MPYDVLGFVGYLSRSYKFLFKKSDKDCGYLGEDLRILW